MRFVIRHKPPAYLWTLERKDGSEVCANANELSSEREARSDIAAAKTAMKGAKFAKVEVDA